MTRPSQDPPQTGRWTGPDRRASGRRRHRRIPGFGTAWVAVLFVGASLVAMAVAPLVTAQRTRAVQTEFEQVLQPALADVLELESLLTRQMVALQGFLLTGDASARQAYRQSAEREAEIHDHLNLLADQLDLSIRRQRAELWTASFEWHQSHAAPLDGLVSRGSFMSQVAEDRVRYNQVLMATQALRQSVEVEVRRGQARMARVNREQRQITVGLMALALVATLLVAILARVLRRLAIESEERRAEAVRVRRAIDAVLEATADGVLGVARDGTCTFMNQAAADLLGVSTWSAQGKDVHAMVHGDGACEDPSCALAQCLQGREAARLSGQWFRDAEGRTFPVQCEVRPMLDGRRLRGLVLTFSDLTEIQAAEKALQDAVNAREEVMAMVSHDLRGPVSTINSAAQLILEVPLPDDQKQEHVRAIERQSRRLGGLIKDLLDVARIEAGVLSVLARPESVASLMDEVHQMLRPTAGQKGVRLERVSPAGPLPRVRVDRPRILQVFANLADNAVRYTEEGGVVSLGARRGTDGVEFFVRDRGPGIPSDRQEDIFDRFRQGSPESGTGAGLGLSIARGIVQAHGGSIWVESREGAGSTFVFTLPLAREGLVGAADGLLSGTGAARLRATVPGSGNLAGEVRERTEEGVGEAGARDVQEPVAEGAPEATARDVPEPAAGAASGSGEGSEPTEG